MGHAADMRTFLGQVLAELDRRADLEEIGCQSEITKTLSL